MRDSVRRFAIVIALTLMASLAVSAVRRSSSLQNERLFAFPMKIGEWSGKEIPMESWVFASLETRFAIMRDYRSGNGRVANLAITWYDDKEVAFHSPEACLGGVGNDVVEKDTISLSVPNHRRQEVGRLLVKKNLQKFLVFYYFISDGQVTSSQTKLRTRILLRRLRFKRGSGALVRLMAPITTNEDAALTLLEKFMRATFPVVIQYTGTESATKR